MVGGAAARIATVDAPSGAAAGLKAAAPHASSRTETGEIAQGIARIFGSARYRERCAAGVNDTTRRARHADPTDPQAAAIPLAQSRDTWTAVSRCVTWVLVVCSCACVCVS